MKRIAELQHDIQEITLTIDQEFPELSKSIMEMPVNDTDNELLHVQHLEEHYNDLVDMYEEHSKPHINTKEKNKTKRSNISSYPLYPPSEDIYSQGKQEPSAPNEVVGIMNEKDFNEDMSGDDLDVPGSELDDEQERIGSEDEENNYYSIGGDNHNDLDEDNGLDKY